MAPILKENCFACHDAKKKSGKYDMTTFEKLMAGGAGRRADRRRASRTRASFHDLIVTDEAAADAAARQGRRPVPKDKVAVIAQWIKEGAKLDAGLDPKADLVKELRVRWKPPAPPEAYPFPAIVNALAFTPGRQATRRRRAPRTDRVGHRHRQAA